MRNFVSRHWNFARNLTYSSHDVQNFGRQRSGKTTKYQKEIGFAALCEACECRQKKEARGRILVPDQERAQTSDLQLPIPVSDLQYLN